MLDPIWESIADCYNTQTPLTKKYTCGQILNFTEHPSSEVRVWTAKALAYEEQSTPIIEMLCKLSTDSDEDVRIEAIDSLSNFTDPRSFDALCHALGDPWELIRAYAAYGVAVVGKETCPDTALSHLLALSENESSNQVLLSTYEGLYILGKHAYLSKLIFLFQTDDYHVKCAVINALAEILSTENYSIIHEFTETLNPETLPASVNSAIMRLKQML
jgi:HEAT repeat protein